MRPITSQLSAFGKHVAQLAKERGITVFEVGQRARISGRSRMLYAMRPRTGKSRSAALTVTELIGLARALRLPPEDMAEFVLMGLLENSPTEIRRTVEQLQKANTVLLRQLGKEPRKMTMEDLGHG